MKINSNSRQLLMLLSIIIAIWPLSSIYGTQPTFVSPLSFNTDVVSYNQNSGIAEIKIISEIPKEEKWQFCKEYSIILLDSKNLSIINSIDGDLDFSSHMQNETLIKFQLQPWDTGRIVISFNCKTNDFIQKYYKHIVAGDSLEIWQGHPRDVAKKPPNKNKDKGEDINPDTLSQEVLNTEYEVLFKFGGEKDTNNIIQLWALCLNWIKEDMGKRISNFLK